MLTKRGLLVPKPCEVCGVVKVERHHEDYSNPYHVRWLCARHHRDVGSGRLKLQATFIATCIDDLIQMKFPPKNSAQDEHNARNTHASP